MRLVLFYSTRVKFADHIDHVTVSIVKGRNIDDCIGWSDNVQLFDWLFPLSILCFRIKEYFDWRPRIFYILLLPRGQLYSFVVKKQKKPERKMAVTFLFNSSNPCTVYSCRQKFNMQYGSGNCL